jgi:hypothetical protein
MKYDIIKTDKYLLVVDDSEIKPLDWCVNIKTSSVFHFYTKRGLVNDDKKIIAHLPLNNSSILNGVNLLPPLEDNNKEVWNEGLEDVLNKLPYTKHLDDGQYNDGVITGFEAGAIWGHNKAKEKYKWTDEDIANAITIAKNSMGVDNDGETCYSHLSTEQIIQSLQQPKYPIAFECEDKIYRVKSGTIQELKDGNGGHEYYEWIGKYIY